MDGMFWKAVRISASVACSRQLQKARSEFWAGAGVFVLEEDVGFFPGLRTQYSGPLREAFLGVALTSQADIAPVCGGDELGARQVFGIGDTKRTAASPKAVEYVVAEPAIVAEFKRGLQFIGNKSQERFQSRKLLFEIRRQTKQHRPAPSLEHGCRPEQLLNRFLGVLQSLEVGNRLRR